jgi:phosphoribosylformimino-5-aminoimidazole carboxamide ribotide isomerase
MRFRPCIDLHQGQVKQLVGATLRENCRPVVHFTADHPAAYYAALYRQDGLTGGHLIMLGPGNQTAARQALAAYSGGLQVGGGITADNAADWIAQGAAQVIVTSYLFRDGRLDCQRLERLVAAVGREQLVIDLSCGRRHDGYVVMVDRWQKATDFSISSKNLETLAHSCSEFLIHAVAVEGRQQGIDRELVELLGAISPAPTTYAGGVRSMEDIETIGRLGGDRLDFTVGSSLDIFGGADLRYAELVAFNQRLANAVERVERTASDR